MVAPGRGIEERSGARASTEHSRDHAEKKRLEGQSEPERVRVTHPRDEGGKKRSQADRHAPRASSIASMSPQSTALRKRVQAPSSNLLGAKKLGAKRLEDITNTHNAGKAGAKSRTKSKTAFANKSGENKVSSSSSKTDSWESWESWTDTATKTFNGVTKLVTEDGRPNLSSPTLSGRSGQSRSNVGSDTIYHNGNALKVGANKKVSVSQDISALKSQGFKAFSSITRSVNSFAQAIEETIDEGIKEVSRSFSAQPGGAGSDNRNLRSTSSSSTSTSSSPASRAAPSVSPAPLRASPLPGASSSPSAALGPAGKSSKAVDYFGHLWTKEIGDMLTGFAHLSSGPLAQSPENKEILERLHHKALEKQNQLETTKQQVIASRLEAKKLQSRNSKLEKHIHMFKNECETLKKENSELRLRVDTAASSASARSDLEDAAAMQLGKQLQILLEEKSKLQRENQRLQSENNGLQELLSYAIPSQLQEGEEGMDAVAGHHNPAQ